MKSGVGFMRRDGELPAEAGAYMLVGWLSRDGTRALDDHGEVVGEFQPGDSFVRPRSVEREPCAG